MAKDYIVIFPFMAQGHIIPFAALASAIHSRNPNLAIHFVNTPLNIQKLRSILQPDSPVSFHALPFSPSDHGLPVGAEDASAIAPHDFPLFLLSSSSLRPHFHRLLADLTERNGRPPRCVVGDYFMGWTAEVARSLGVAHATFAASGAYGTACMISLWLHLPAAGTGSPEFHVPGFPSGFRMRHSQLPASMRRFPFGESTTVFLQEQFTLALAVTDAVLCNTIEELEVLGLDALRRLTRAPIWPVGPLNSGSYHSRRSGNEMARIQAKSYLQWMDSHQPGSTVYVSFGSKGYISASQMMALAAGLEASGVPFVWVIRPPIGCDVTGEFKAEWLPEGFESRMTETKKGLLVKEWAPQFEILSHKSIAAFLSHCGWNSVLESLGLGVPIIGWPLDGDQTFNSKMLKEELEVGIQVATGVQDEVEAGKIAAAIKLVVAEEKGKEMKKKAMVCAEKIKAAMGDGGGQERGSSLRALDGFIETLPN